MTQESGVDGNRNFGTLQSKDVIAAELENSANGNPTNPANGCGEVVDNRPQPPPSQQFSEMAGQVGIDVKDHQKCDLRS